MDFGQVLDIGFCKARLAQMPRYSPEFEQLPEVVKGVLRQTRGAGGHEEEDVYVVPAMVVDASNRTHTVIDPNYPNLGCAERHDPFPDDISGCDFDLK